MDRSLISDADILRSREDPRLRQLLLARGLEQLLTSLHRTQRSTSVLKPRDVQTLREGAMMAVELADRIRAIEDNLHRASKAA